MIKGLDEGNHDLMGSATMDETSKPDVERLLECKVYHKTKATAKVGSLRNRNENKSRCPDWADDPKLQAILLKEALIDSGGSLDWKGRPKRIWNAVAGQIFVGVSCNTEEPRYNCYPEHPPDGKLIKQLKQRAERNLSDVLDRPEIDGG